MKLRSCFTRSGTDVGRARIISLMGLGRSVGTTHLAIMLGMYLANGIKCRVALVEYGQHGVYEQIRREEKTKQVRLSTNVAERHAFSFRGITFYESVQNGGLIGMLADSYDYIIVDMRAEDTFLEMTQLLGDWLRADVSIAVIAQTPWQSRECRIRLNRMVGRGMAHAFQTVSLTEPFTTSRRKKRVYKNVMLIPWEPNPFQIRAESMPWLKKLAESGRNIYHKKIED